MVTITVTRESNNECHAGMIYNHALILSTVSYLAPADPTAKPLPLSSMDFQLARNLSALSRAQHEISEALLHIDCLSDLLNREIIMSATCSEATEQLVVTARATLTQVQITLETQSNEGARRLRESQINFIATRRNRSSRTSSSPDSFHDGQASDQ